MKKLIALVLAAMMSVAAPASALEYGEEWSGYTDDYKTSYTDVKPTHWAYNAIERASAKNWFSGYPDGTFRPSASIKRSEAMTVFVTFLGLQLAEVTNPTYYDVRTTDWYAPYIEAGKKLFPERQQYNGQTPFQPEMPITREDAIYALVIALKYNDLVRFADQSVLNMFSDQNSISAIVKPYAAVAVSKGLVSGHPNGTIGAQDPLTRAEFATLLYKASTIGYGTGGGLEDVASVESIELGTPLVTELTVGDKLTITANAKMSDGTTVSYSDNLNPYNSSNNNVVLMNKNEVTAVSAGTAIIKFNGDALLADKNLVINVKAPVIVEEPEEEVEEEIEEEVREEQEVEEEEQENQTANDADASIVSYSWSVDSLDLNEGETSKIKLIGTYSDGSTKDLTREYNIYSTDEEVVTVSADGKIEAVGEGTAKINMGGASLSSVSTARPLSVTVRAAGRNEIKALAWSVDEVALSVGETETIKLYAVYSDGSKEDVTEECGIYAMDEDIAVVDGGEIEGIAAGETELWFDSMPVAGIDLPEMLLVTVD